MPEEKCLLRFADQFNYGFTNSKVNESFEFDDDRVQKFYDVKQLVRAYPMIADVYAKRKTWDPQSLFTNNFAETYGPLLNA